MGVGGGTRDTLWCPCFPFFCGRRGVSFVCVIGLFLFFTQRTLGIMWSFLYFRYSMFFLVWGEGFSSVVFLFLVGGEGSGGEGVLPLRLKYLNGANFFPMAGCLGYSWVNAASFQHGSGQQRFWTGPSTSVGRRHKSAWVSSSPVTRQTGTCHLLSPCYKKRQQHMARVVKTEDRGSEGDGQVSSCLRPVFSMMPLCGTRS